MLTRPRTDADLEGCLALMRRTHESDGYPRYWRSDAVGFLVSPAERAAFVAVGGDGVLHGHVALHQATDDPTLPAARRRTGLPADRLAVVARLLVSPGSRRAGVGRALLDRATAEAHAAGCRPVLDVIQVDTGPVTLYERAGWERLEPLLLPVEGHPPLHLWVYLGPEPAAR